jgi:hypothetical protein
MFFKFLFFPLYKSARKLAIIMGNTNAKNTEFIEVPDAVIAEEIPPPIILNAVVVQTDEDKDGDEDGEFTEEEIKMFPELSKKVQRERREAWDTAKIVNPWNVSIHSNEATRSHILQIQKASKISMRLAHGVLKCSPAFIKLDKPRGYGVSPDVIIRPH